MPASETQTGWRPVLGLALGLTVLLTTLLVAFGLPAVRTAPRGVPVAVVAPPQVAQSLEAGLERAQPGAFDVRTAGSEAEAEVMIRNRDVYGAFVVGADGLRVDTASAAGPTVAQVLTAVGQNLGPALGVPVAVADVVPLSAGDPRGVGLSAGALPIALGGLAAGVAMTMLLAGAWRRVAGMAAFAVLSGLAMTAVLQFWFQTTTGSYAATAAVAVLGVLATGMTVLGLEALLGRVGIGLAALVVVILGNPLSGLASAPEMLPRPWGALGQLLPPGATGTLLRNVAFFDGAAVARPLLVLGAWLALGAATFWLGTVRGRDGAAAPYPGGAGPSGGAGV